MKVEHLEILVEEPSMEAFLQRFLPPFLGGLSFQVHPFQSKSELLQRLPLRLLGYRAWLPPSWRILVLVDRDRDDCQQLKGRLEAMASKAGLETRSSRNPRNPGSFSVVNRIVIEELEAWYFGDWQAVRAVYPRVSRNLPNQKAFRDPDAIGGGTWEAFERTLQRAGYFPSGLRKIEAARQIAPRIDPARNSSNSFRQFFEVLSEALDRSVDPRA